MCISLDSLLMTELGFSARQKRKSPSPECWTRSFDEAMSSTRSPFAYKLANEYVSYKRITIAEFNRMYKVWHLRLTIHFLSDAGNMLDCACLAGITALKHFRRPEVEVVGEDEVIVVSLSLEVFRYIFINLIIFSTLLLNELQSHFRYIIRHFV